MGDKTQLATLLFVADKEVNKLTVFFAASLALVVASAVGVLAAHFSEKALAYIAGAGFMLIGAYTLYQAKREKQLSKVFGLDLRSGA
ncbi:MAG: TMEM165/GDT1 family protein [Candidatus Reddybacter sp.]